MSESDSRQNPFKRLRRNSVYGLLSTVIPTLILLAAYPVLISPSEVVPENWTGR